MHEAPSSIGDAQRVEGPFIRNHVRCWVVRSHGISDHFRTVCDRGVEALELGEEQCSFRCS